MQFALVSRINVLTAIRDHDLQGAGAFAEALGFETTSEEILVERGRRYDARALLAYAYGKATGQYLGPDDVTLAGLDVLTDLEFRVTTRAELERPTPAPAAKRSRSASGSSRPTRPAKPEPVVRVCPSCFTQLSVAGTCDYCD